MRIFFRDLAQRLQDRGVNVASCHQLAAGLAGDERSLASDVSQSPEPGALDAKLKQHLEHDLANMRRTFEALDSHKLEQIVEELLKARRLWLLGYRNSGFLAAYARWQFAQLREQVHLLQSGTETLAEQLVDLRPDDLVVVLGFRRRPSRLRVALESIHAPQRVRFV